MKYLGYEIKERGKDADHVELILSWGEDCNEEINKQISEGIKKE